jgi:ferredoxin
LEILVRVNPRVCAGTRACRDRAPEFFVEGNRGVSRPAREAWSEADLPLLREAENDCPSGALTVETDEDAED